MLKTKAPPVISIDFETKGIERRPKYPPKPVSVALHWPGEREYELLAWGHGDGSRAAGNNCTEKEARGRLKRAYDSRYPLLFQYGMFDLDVAETHWELPLPSWERTHDTMFLLFLNDPHAPSLGLKESAERLLGIKPEEQDKMKAWILANVPEAKRKPSEWGAYIWRCPYQIVKPYHKGDLVRTYKIFVHLYPYIIDSGMGPAYDRERRLMPILLRNARRGMRVDLPKLEQDIPKMREGIEKADKWLRKKLGIENIDSDRQLGQALYEKKLITEVSYTKKGQISTSKKALTIDRFRDKQVYSALQYRGQMSTSLGTFAEPWFEQASTSPESSLYPNWSQVRAPRAGGDVTGGARSGRIICSNPNFLNIPKKWKRAITLGYVHPVWLNVPDLPFMRSYILPHKGKRWGRRDMNQQEVRLFAHYEEGPVMEGFLADPRYDMHEGVRAEEEAALIAAGLRDEFDRDSAKTTVFGAFYGQGLTGLMEALRLRDPEDRAVGQAIHRALHRAVPSIGTLSGALKALAAEGRPIKTWGDRLYYEEPPKYSEKFNRDMTFAYKLISYLIQGSGADVVKEVIVRYDEHPKRQEDLVVTVYDELDVDLPMSDKGARQEMSVVKECIESIEIDIPMLSDGEVGPSWGELKPWKD
jgi:DNA polymerase I-like protein with 3'-5' exonuclease and polymerase domains